MTNIVGNLFVSKSAETFGYDADGNTTNDGRWTYTWDGENRLVKVESRADTPQVSWRKVEWEYDALGRRIRQTTSDGSSGTWQVTEDLKFVSDPVLFGRHIAELNATNNALARSYVWGLDLSGTLDGAGGVGGLLCVTMNSGPTADTHFVAYDGNGNVVGLVSANTGTETARYEYGPFAESIRLSGPAGRANSFRFSTKRTDETTDLVLYEYRAYSPTLGRWLSRDPIGEIGGVNRYAFGWNDTLSCMDLLGLYVERPPTQPQPPPAPPEPVPAPPRIPPPQTRIGPPQVALCIIVGVVFYCASDYVSEKTGAHEKLSDYFAQVWDRAKCVLCSHRHPIWPKCQKRDPRTPEEAMMRAIAEGQVPVYPGFNGPHFAGCEYQGPAHGCRGMANDGFYRCKAIYWSQWTAHVTTHYYTVLTCYCCYTFGEGKYAVFKHRSGEDKTSPPRHF